MVRTNETEDTEAPHHSQAQTGALRRGCCILAMHLFISKMFTQHLPPQGLEGRPSENIKTERLCSPRTYSSVNRLQVPVSVPVYRYFYCCSVAKSCPTLCDTMDRSTPGLPVLHYLLEFAQIHVHSVSDAD